MINVTLNDYKNVYGSFTTYIVLLTVFFIISISISNAFIYFNCYLKKSNTGYLKNINTGVTNINPSTETVIY